MVIPIRTGKIVRRGVCFVTVLRSAIDCATCVIPTSWVCIFYIMSLRHWHRIPQRQRPNRSNYRRTLAVVLLLRDTKACFDRATLYSFVPSRANSVQQVMVMGTYQNVNITTSGMSKPLNTSYSIKRRSSARQHVQLQSAQNNSRT